MIHQLQFEHWVPFRMERVFVFFANPENLPRIMPPATRTRLDGLRIVPPPELQSAPTSDVAKLAGAGSEIGTSFRVFPYLPFRARWVARITEFEWYHHFADIQVKGPFRSWHHRHEMMAETRDGVEGTLVRDRIGYELPLGRLSEIASGVLSSQMAGTFRYRQEILPKLLRTAK